MSSPNKKLRIAFLWDWENDAYQLMTWRDGLAAAIRELRDRGHEVLVVTCGKDDEVDMEYDHPYFTIFVTTDPVGMIEAYGPDVILQWGDFTRPHAKALQELGIPTAICFAGGEAVNYNTPYFDHIFVESQVYKKKLEAAGYDNVSIAFGTNTELFKPVIQPKLIDVVFPATFALWKRHNLFARSVEGLHSLAVGYMYSDHEQECWEDCLKYGVTVLPHLSAEALQRVYAASRACLITSMSSGGSQRTVLEAMAMNVPLVITDSDKFDYAWESDEVFQVAPEVEDIRKTIDYILENNITVNTRDYVVKNWSEFTYADAIEKGLKSICA